MKHAILLLLLSVFSVNLSFGQEREKYAEFVEEAWSLYNSKDYLESANKYVEAFDQLEGKAYPSDRYNAACSFALANDVESSFYHLFRLAEGASKYKNYNHITIDTDLNVLHQDKRWEKLISMVKANKEEYEKDFDQELVAELDEIHKLDQSYRMQIGDIEEKFGRKSPEMTAHWKLINKTDSMNLIKVKKILDEKGWLGADVVGNSGNSTLFLVIQHADIETQKQYLPLMRDAVTKGNARAGSLALLEDRVALREGNPQIYGSQIGRDPDSGKYYVSPLIEPEKVNERRAQVGLGTIESYIKNWDMTWDIEAHKKRSKKELAKMKKTQKLMKKEKKRKEKKAMKNN